jgi:quercetin dioxygenase-like cupin family protein
MAGSFESKGTIMNRVKLTATLLFLLISTMSYANDVPSSDTQVRSARQGMKSQAVIRAGTRPSSQGPAEYFTGKVRVSPLFPENASTPVAGAYVSFEPGARSAWHTHPSGQHLIVTAGTGWTQEWGGPPTEIHEGDVVWCPPGVKHWHGASATSAMTHLALTGTVNGKNVEWMEKVTDGQYRK